MPIKTATEIKNFSYTDFVGFINQWNVLPGAYSTLSKWLVYSGLNEKSNLLEIACTSGFSSRELALSSDCKGVGIDISQKSIEAANLNKKLYAPNINIKYECIDAYKYSPASKFSHIVVGASLKFFPNPEEMMKLCINWLNDGGEILASPFFVKSDIPQPLVKRAQKVFGITPTTTSYKNIMKLYHSLEIIFEEKIDHIEQETEEELDYYCNSTVKRACAMRKITDKNIYDLIYKRLMEIKVMSNDLRPYQGYSVLVLKYRKNVYPNRWVELF